jgi:hypothetical protein
VNFVNNIFEINYESISNVQNEIYSFNVANLDFEEDNENILKIQCFKEGQQIVEDYSVIFDPTQIDIGITRTSIN